jgi:hypothetical protein
MKEKDVWNMVMRLRKSQLRRGKPRKGKRGSGSEELLTLGDGRSFRGSDALDFARANCALIQSERDALWALQKAVDKRYIELSPLNLEMCGPSGRESDERNADEFHVDSIWRFSSLILEQPVTSKRRVVGLSTLRSSLKRDNRDRGTSMSDYGGSSSSSSGSSSSPSSSSSGSSLGSGELNDALLQVRATRVNEKKRLFRRTNKSNRELDAAHIDRAVALSDSSLCDDGDGNDSNNGDYDDDGDETDDYDERSLLESSAGCDDDDAAAAASDSDDGDRLDGTLQSEDSRKLLESLRGYLRVSASPSANDTEHPIVADDDDDLDDNDLDDGDDDDDDDGELRRTMSINERSQLEKAALALERAASLRVRMFSVVRVLWAFLQENVALQHALGVPIVLLFAQLFGAWLVCVAVALMVVTYSYRSALLDRAESQRRLVRLVRGDALRERKQRVQHQFRFLNGIAESLWANMGMWLVDGIVKAKINEKMAEVLADGDSPLQSLRLLRIALGRDAAALSNVRHVSSLSAANKMVLDFTVTFASADDAKVSLQLQLRGVNVTALVNNVEARFSLRFVVRWNNALPQRSVGAISLRERPTLQLTVATPGVRLDALVPGFTNMVNRKIVDAMMSVMHWPQVQRFRFDGGDLEDELEEKHGANWKRENPICDIAMLHTETHSELPEHFEVLSQTPSELTANLYAGNQSAKPVYLCYRRRSSSAASSDDSEPPLLPITAVAIVRTSSADTPPPDGWELAARLALSMRGRIRKHSIRASVLVRREPTRPPIADLAIINGDTSKKKGFAADRVPEGFLVAQSPLSGQRGAAVNLNPGSGRTVFLCYRLGDRKSSLLVRTPPSPASVAAAASSSSSSAPDSSSAASAQRALSRPPSATKPLQAAADALAIRRKRQQLRPKSAMVATSDRHRSIGLEAAEAAMQRQIGHRRRPSLPTQRLSPDEAAAVPATDSSKKAMPLALLDSLRLPLAELGDSPAASSSAAVSPRSMPVTALAILHTNKRTPARSGPDGFEVLANTVLGVHRAALVASTRWANAGRQAATLGVRDRINAFLCVRRSSGASAHRPIVEVVVCADRPPAASGTGWHEVPRITSDGRPVSALGVRSLWTIWYRRQPLARGPPHLPIVDVGLVRNTENRKRKRPAETLPNAYRMVEHMLDSGRSADLGRKRNGLFLCYRVAPPVSSVTFAAHKRATISPSPLSSSSSSSESGSTPSAPFHRLETQQFGRLVAPDAQPQQRQHGSDGERRHHSASVKQSDLALLPASMVVRIKKQQPMHSATTDSMQSADLRTAQRRSRQRLQEFRRSSSDDALDKSLA